MPAVVKERLQRVLGLPKRMSGPSTGLKAAFLIGPLLLIGFLAVFSDHTPDLSHLRVGVLSASERGNYYAIVSALAAEARQQKGRIDNVTSAGSVENISRLMAGRTLCDVQFALVQDGMSWPAGHSLELIGRLSKAESLVFLGRGTERIKTLADLRGMRIGIGPIGSGTESVARQVLAPLEELDITLSTQGIDEQFVRLERGELDLGAMVIDEDARLPAEAVRNRGLQILSLPNGDLGPAHPRVLAAQQRDVVVAPIPSVAHRREPDSHRKRDPSLVWPGGHGGRHRCDAAERETPRTRGAGATGHHCGGAHHAVGEVPAAIAIDARTHGPGDGLPLPGGAYRRPPACPSHFRERLDQGRASAAIHLDHVPQPKTGAEADACDGHAPSAKEVEPT
jgi:hypothetical protein